MLRRGEVRITPAVENETLALSSLSSTRRLQPQQGTATGDDGLHTLLTRRWRASVFSGQQKQVHIYVMFLSNVLNKVAADRSGSFCFVCVKLERH